MVNYPASAPALDADLEAPGLFESLWRFRVMAVGLVVVFSALGVGVSFLLPSQSTATARVALADPRGNSVFRQANSSAADLERYTGERAGFATSDRVLERAAELLPDRPSLTKLDDKIKAAPASGADVVVISAMDKTPSRAAATANAVARSYEMVSAEDTRTQAAGALKAIDDTRARLVGIIDAAQGNGPSAAAQRQAASDALRQQDQRANEVIVNAALFGAGVQYVDPASVPEPNVSATAVRSGAAGAILGFLVALAVAWVRADRYRTAEQGEGPARVLLAPLLGEIKEPSRKGPPRRLADMPWDPVDSYQLVASTLRSAIKAGVVVVSSTGPDHEGSLVTANLAAAAARDGRRVVVVDADNRRRTLSKLAGAQEGVGLSELVAGSAHVPAAVRDVRLSGLHEFALIPAGGPIEEAASVFRSDGMTRLVQQLRATNDLVILSGAPILAAPETSSLIAHADGVVLIVAKGTRLQLLQQIRQHLDLFPTPLLGYLFTAGGEGGVPRVESEPAPVDQAVAGRADD